MPAPLLSALAVAVATSSAAGTSPVDERPGGPRLAPIKPAAPPSASTTVKAAPRAPWADAGALRITPQVGFMVGRLREVTPSVGGEVTYDLGAAFRVGLFGTYLFPARPSDELVSKFKTRDQDEVALDTELLWAAGVVARWRPIQAVVAWDRAAVAHLGLDIGVGFGLGDTRVPCDNQTELDPNRGFPTDSMGQTVCNPDQAATQDGVIDQVFYEPNTRRPVGALEAVLTATLSSRVGLQVAVRDVVFVSRVYRPGSTDALSDEVLHRASLVLGVSLIL